MKTSKQRVVEFMEAKQEYLDKHSDCKVSYFRDTDKQLLNNFTEEECLDFINEYEILLIENSFSIRLFTSTTCIFCFKYGRNCGECNYGKIKGICATGRDTWSFIPEGIRLTPIPSEIHEILIN